MQPAVAEDVVLALDLVPARDAVELAPDELRRLPLVGRRPERERQLVAMDVHGARPGTASARRRGRSAGATARCARRPRARRRPARATTRRRRRARARGRRARLSAPKWRGLSWIASGCIPVSNRMFWPACWIRKKKYGTTITSPHAGSIAIRSVPALFTRYEYVLLLHHRNIVQISTSIGSRAARSSSASSSRAATCGCCSQLRAPPRYDIAVTIIAELATGLHAAHEATGRTARRSPRAPRCVVRATCCSAGSARSSSRDFGVAKARLRSYHTVSGTIKGKAPYMAPEQILGEPLDRRADVFSLGVLLFEVTTRTRLYSANAHANAMKQILDGDVPDPAERRPGYPPSSRRSCAARSRAIRDRSLSDRARARRRSRCSSPARSDGTCRAPRSASARARDSCEAAHERRQACRRRSSARVEPLRRRAAIGVGPYVLVRRSARAARRASISRASIARTASSATS